MQTDCTKSKKSLTLSFERLKYNGYHTSLNVHFLKNLCNTVPKRENTTHDDDDNARNKFIKTNAKRQLSRVRTPFVSGQTPR